MSRGPHAGWHDYPVRAFARVDPRCPNVAAAAILGRVRVNSKNSGRPSLIFVDPKTLDVYALPCEHRRVARWVSDRAGWLLGSFHDRARRPSDELLWTITEALIAWLDERRRIEDRRQMRLF